MAGGEQREEAGEGEEEADEGRGEAVGIGRGERRGSTRMRGVHRAAVMILGVDVALVALQRQLECTTIPPLHRGLEGGVG